MRQLAGRRAPAEVEGEDAPDVDEEGALTGSPVTAPPAPVDGVDAVVPGGHLPGRSHRPGLGVVVPVALLALWWFASASGSISPRLLPSPGAVAEAAWDFVAGPGGG
ncbi:MAG: hypothetical protein M3P53_05565, partial [Actinomycetota bacterium]|nr:hypothetical protein [Actinomycetota bacterium]